MLGHEDLQRGWRKQKEEESQVVIWDAHAGFAPSADGDLSILDEWRDVGTSYLSINVGWDVLRWQETLTCTAHYRRWLETHSDHYVVADSLEDVRSTRTSGKLAVGFDLEGGKALNGDVNMVGVYHRLGVRHMNLAYNLNNELGGGCLDVDVPLTNLGRQVVAEMNRVGMVVDVSHTGYRTSLDVLSCSSMPVIFSHSNPRKLCDNPRNIWDDQIKACAGTGGVVSINGVSAFLGEDEPTVETLVRHIDYVVELVGIDHVGIGLDSVLDPDEMRRLLKRYPDAWPDRADEILAVRFLSPRELPRVIKELEGRGYRSDDVEKIMGGNHLRVADKVWRN